VHNTPYSTVNIPEVMTRNSAARDMVTGFATALPALAAMWQYIQTALADVGDLTAEVTRLSAAVQDVRLDRANAFAAMRATIAAERDGETDPLSYLRDELKAARGDPAARAGGKRG
jgi:hypothetical protein